jgi:hypothetical protein
MNKTKLIEAYANTLVKLIYECDAKYSPEAYGFDADDDKVCYLEGEEYSSMLDDMQAGDLLHKANYISTYADRLRNIYLIDDPIDASAFVYHYATGSNIPAGYSDEGDRV